MPGPLHLFRCGTADLSTVTFNFDSEAGSALPSGTAKLTINVPGPATSPSAVKALREMAAPN